jgi:predicted nuclease of predicted toxin-antitoxin system
MIWRLLLDQNFNRRFLREAVRYCEPDVDDVRLIDLGLQQLADGEVLAWAAREDRIVLSHDVNTMGAAADARLVAGLPMAGLVLIHQDAAYRPVIADLCLVFQASNPTEWQNRILRLPLPQSLPLRQPPKGETPAR